MTPPLAPPPEALLGSISAFAALQLCVRLQACSLLCVWCGGPWCEQHTNTHFPFHINGYAKGGCMWACVRPCEGFMS